MQYPKELEVETPLSEFEKESDAPQLLKEVVARTKFTLLEENILQIDYPQNLVEQVREVNIDNWIYRIDFIYRDEPLSLKNCFFPKVPWTSKNFFRTGRFGKGKRTESENRIVIEYPRIESEEIVLGRRRFRASRLMPNYQGVYDCKCEECAFGTYCPQDDPFGQYRNCGRVYCIENIVNYLEHGNSNVWVKDPLTDEEKNSPLTEDEIYVMKSALRVHEWDDPETVDGKLMPYRNRFAAEPGTDDHMTWDYLVEREMARGWFDGQYDWYYLTERGIRELGKVMGCQIELIHKEED